MAFRMLYLLMIRVFGWPLLLSRSQAFKDAELMMLRVPLQNSMQAP